MPRINVNVSIKPNYNNLTANTMISSSHIASIDNNSDILDINKYYREIAIKKWAEVCEGTLKSQYTDKELEHIIFIFPSIEKLEQFQEQANSFINKAIPYIENYMKEQEKKSKIHIKYKINTKDLIIKSNYNDLTATVTTLFPIQDRLLITKNISTIRNYFIEKRDTSSNIQDKISYDRAKAICDWAELCRANLESHKYIDNKIYFKFSFQELKWLQLFEEKAQFKINQYTMNSEDISYQNRKK